MLFNELIEKEGLEKIVSKTNISSVNLEYLANEEFSKLNRVKALGFLLILEREYPEIDVNQLRQNVKLYFEENTPADDKVVMVAQDSIDNTSGGFSFFKLFILAAILGGGYYLYEQGKLNSIVENVQEENDFFDDNKALESNATSADAQKVVVGKPQADSIHIETPAVTTQKSKASDEKESTKRKEEPLKTAQPVLQEQETAQSTEAVVQKVTNEFLAKEAETKTLIEEEENSLETPTTIKTVTIHPTRGMLWYGFINLDTKKRREFMKKVSSPFEINDGKWLLVTGHGYLEIISDAKTVEVADNKKHYFYIDSHDIKEISRDEFRELNGHRGW